MASQVPQPAYVPNFKAPLDERKAKKSWRRERPGNSEPHLSLVRKLPCCCCLRVEGNSSDPHHLKGGGAKIERGTGLRSSDKWAVPMCRQHHDEVERLGSRREPDFFEYFGIYPYALADALWRSTGDYARLLKIVLAHHGKRSRSQ